VDIGVLPCPTYFDQVIFMETHAERNSIARARVEYDARVRPSDMGLNRKAHAGAITDEWSEIKTQWSWLRLLLRTENRRERDQQQHRDENQHIDCFLSQFSVSPILTLNTIASGITHVSRRLRSDLVVVVKRGFLANNVQGNGLFN
jgi:hypothetical protein